MREIVYSKCMISHVTATAVIASSRVFVKRSLTSGALRFRRFFKIGFWIHIAPDLMHELDDLHMAALVGEERPRCDIYDVSKLKLHGIVVAGPLFADHWFLLNSSP